MSVFSVAQQNPAIVSPDVGTEEGYPSPLRAWLTVGILVVASLVSYVDRQIVAILVGPMKADLHVSDSTIGWLYGIFALFYAVAGIPIAMLADRYTRSRLIAAGVFVWSIMTGLSGLARNFLQLLLARIGVGVGEAVLTPATSSLIADLFPRSKIPLAVSAFQAGATIGSGLAFVVGGLVLGVVQSAGRTHVPLLGELSPWQKVYLVCGIPGLVLAPLILMLRDPRRRELRRDEPTGATWGSIVQFYRVNRATLLLHHVGFLCLALMGFGFVFWSVSFFARVHGMEPAKAAPIFGCIQMVAGPLGSIAAPALAARLLRSGRRDAHITAAMLGGVCAMGCIMIVQAMPSAATAFICYVPALFFVSSPFGLAYGSLPVITPAPMRAVVTSVFMLVVNLGMLLGPPIAGVFNERVYPGSDGVRWSLLTLTPIFGITGLIVLGLCRRHYATTLDAADRLAEAAVP
jgi:MFS family permease